MKTLGSKIAYVKKWLESGKPITRMQSISDLRYTNLPDAIWKLKRDGMWIIDIGKPRKYAKYIMLDRGPIKNLMIKGYRMHIDDAHYIDGFQDMEIHMYANNGVRGVYFKCNEDAFRDKKVMENKLKEALK